MNTDSLNDILNVAIDPDYWDIWNKRIQSPQVRAKSFSDYHSFVMHSVARICAHLDMGLLCRSE